MNPRTLVLHEDVWSAPRYLEVGTARTIGAWHPRMHPGETPTRRPEPRGPMRRGPCPDLARGRRRAVASSASNAAAVPVPSVFQAANGEGRAVTGHEVRTLADAARSSEAPYVPAANCMARPHCCARPPLSVPGVLVRNPRRTTIVGATAEATYRRIARRRSPMARRRACPRFGMIAGALQSCARRSTHLTGFGECH